MNRAITDTNIILNLAISPSLWLLSNNMIILKKPVPGYNNRLKIANAFMKFGYNPINRDPPKTLNGTAKLEKEPTVTLPTTDKLPAK